jgi:MFS family permease
MLTICFQGVAMPAMNNILSKWIPVSERSRSLSLVYSGMYLGSVVGLAFSPFLIQTLGWPSVFYSFGSLGSIWFAFWLRKVSQFSLNFDEIYFMYLSLITTYLRVAGLLEFRFPAVGGFHIHVFGSRLDDKK